MLDNIFSADKAIPNQEMKIKEIKDSGISIKLLEMGIMPGKIMTLLHIAPLGDPLAFQLGDSLIALRKNEAMYINVVNRNTFA